MLLRQMLYRTELRLLPVIASYWINIKTKPNYEELIRMLCVRMLDPDKQKIFFDSPSGKELVPAFSELLQRDGIETVERFEEAFGPLRFAGIDKILREKYWTAPVSITEKLWYRGLIFRENRIICSEPRECYIIPEDLRRVIQQFVTDANPVTNPHEDFTVRPAIPAETKSVNPLNNSIPDFATISAALLRDKRSLDFPGANLSEKYIKFIESTLHEAFSFESDTETEVNSIRNFLVQNRTSAKIQLIGFWRNNISYDELSECEKLNIVDLPDYDKKSPRETIIRFISELPSDVWWSINGFISSVKKTDPLFLRKNLQHNRSQILDIEGNDLSGIGSWYQLEGAYIRYLLLGPLQWLGLIQIAYTDKSHNEASAFRIDRDTAFFLSESIEEQVSGSIRSKPNLETAFPIISSDGAISCGTGVPRYFRYMAVRFCEIENIKGEILTLRITPASLARAESRGLSRSSFLNLLKRFTGNRIPKSLERMLDSSEIKALPATIYNATILTIPNETVFAELLNTPRFEKWILQQINLTSLVIDPKGIGEIRRFLMEHEIFVDIQV